MLRIMLVDETAARSFYLRLVLEEIGYRVVAEVSAARELHDAVLRLSPDVIIVDTESPSRDTLEHLCLLTESCPRPIVMFSQDASRDSIREAVRSGVSAYVVDGMSPGRINPIVEAAVARFEAFQAVRSELSDVKSMLSERKLVEKAKGILMKSRSISEDEAYRALRKLAMDKKQRLADIARQVIALADLLA